MPSPNLVMLPVGADRRSPARPTLPKVRQGRVTVPAAAAGVATAAAVLALAGCAVEASSVPVPTRVPEPTPTQDLLLDLEDRAAPVGAVIPSVTNAAVSPIRSRVVTAAGGRIRREQGAEGGYAIRFPAFSSQQPSPLAVLLVHAEGEDFLAPGERDFTIGLDFMLDRESAGGEVDDGDNLVQRGLYADREQFKLQVDAGILSCRIRGPAGEALAKSEHAVPPERWHRVSCTRSGDQVRMSVQRLTPGGWGAAEVVDVEAPTGALRFRESRAPLAIGGKVTATGAVVPSSPDQFNGVIDNVRYEVRDPS